MLCIVISDVSNELFWIACWCLFGLGFGVLIADRGCFAVLIRVALRVDLLSLVVCFACAFRLVPVVFGFGELRCCFGVTCCGGGAVRLLMFSRDVAFGV